MIPRMLHGHRLAGSRATTVLLGVLAASSTAANLACSIGSGSGVVQGDLTMLGCTEGHDKVDEPYSLNPTFFAGEPLDDTSPTKTHNQLVLRLQNANARAEVADTVTFWITSTYEVARCVAGYQKPDGTPDWDTALCDRSTGTPRVRIGDGGQVIHAAFSPYSTCPNAGLLDGYSALLSGVALGECNATDATSMALNPVGCPAACPDHDSWIEFSIFGGASAAKPAEIGKTFLVNFEETIQASAFHLGLCDNVAVQANRDRKYVPPPRLTGTLDGKFDFDVLRGQGAQTFP